MMERQPNKTMIEKHFQYWIFLTLFSVVSLVCMVSIFDQQDNEYWSAKQRWVIAAASISLIMSCCASVFHVVFKERFLGKPVEIAWVVIVLAMWCGALPTLLGSGRLLYVSGADPGAVVLGDLVLYLTLFFSSWLGLIVSLMLCTSHIQLHFNRQDDKHLFHWVGFAVSSLVVTSSTAVFWKNVCSEDGTDSDVCSRDMFGLVLGLISFVAGVCIAWIQVDRFIAQIASLVLLVAWCFAVSYLTFNEGPGVSFGSLYFATWLGLFFVLMVAAPAALEIFQKMAGTYEEAVEGDAAGKDGEKTPQNAKVGGDEAEEEEVAEHA